MSVEPAPAPTSRVPRRRPGRPVIAVALVLVALIGGVAWWNVVDPEWHADGGGPLSSLRGGSVGMSSPIAQGETITFGLELCTLDGSTAVIASIGPHASVGSGATLVGAGIRHTDRSATNADMIGSVHGYPPDGYDPSLWTDAIGFSVTHRCEHPDPKAYTELIVGLRADRAESGGWHGIDVGYQSGWRHRVVTIRYDLILCRPSDPDCTDELLQ